MSTVDDYAMMFLEEPVLALCSRTYNVMKILKRGAGFAHLKRV